MIGVSNEPSRVSILRLTAAAAQERIRAIARVSEDVILGNHARDRMAERDILDVDVFRILRSGYVDDQPRLTNHGEWKCKVTLKIRGGRTAGVITVILHSGQLFVKSVEWEDLS